MDDLKAKLKEQIISALNLEEVDITSFENDTPLFGEFLGLDSIDALELIVLLENDYNIKLTDPEKGRAIFQSVDTLANFITKKQQGK